MRNDLMATYYAKNSSVDMPEMGLALHASLNGATPNIAETGQTIVWTGTPTFRTIAGIPCMRHIKGTALMGEVTENLTTTSGWTMSAWINYGTGLGDQTWLFGAGNGAWGHHLVFHVNGNSWYTGVTAGGSDGPDIATTIQPSATAQWHHFLATVDLSAGRGYFYYDGERRRIVTWTTTHYEYRYPLIRFCTDYDTTNRPKRGNYYMAGCRLYNRVLTAAEIDTLSREFTPTT